jgi:hypothetical protein
MPIDSSHSRAALFFCSCSKANHFSRVSGEAKKRFLEAAECPLARNRHLQQFALVLVAYPSVRATGVNPGLNA